MSCSPVSPDALYGAIELLIRRMIECGTLQGKLLSCDGGELLANTRVVTCESLVEQVQIAIDAEQLTLPGIESLDLVEHQLNLVDNNGEVHSVDLSPLVSSLFKSAVLTADYVLQLTRENDELFEVDLSALAGQAVCLEDTNTIDFEGTGVCNDRLKAHVIVDPAGDNLLTTSDEGLKAALHSESTESIDLSGAGVEADTLQATLRLSEAAENLATIDGGLSVVLVKNNSDSIEFSGAGTQESPVTAAVRLDPDPNNALQISSAGLLGTGRVVFADTNSIEVGGEGSTAAPYTLDLVVDPVEGNLVEVSPAGVSAQVRRVDSTSIAWVAPAEDEPAGQLQAVIQRSPATGNVLELRENGVYVPSSIGASLIRVEHQAVNVDAAAFSRDLDIPETVSYLHVTVVAPGGQGGPRSPVRDGDDPLLWYWIPSQGGGGGAADFWVDVRSIKAYNLSWVGGTRQGPMTEAQKTAGYAPSVNAAGSFTFTRTDRDNDTSVVVFGGASGGAVYREAPNTGGANDYTAGGAATVRNYSQLLQGIVSASGSPGRSWLIFPGTTEEADHVQKYMAPPGEPGLFGGSGGILGEVSKTAGAGGTAHTTTVITADTAGWVGGRGYCQIEYYAGNMTMSAL